VRPDHRREAAGEPARERLMLQMNESKTISLHEFEPDAYLAGKLARLGCAEREKWPAAGPPATTHSRTFQTSLASTVTPRRMPTSGHAAVMDAERVAPRLSSSTAFLWRESCPAHTCIIIERHGIQDSCCLR